MHKLTSQNSHQSFQTGVFCMYIALFRSFPVSGHMLHEGALSKVTYHTAHCLSAIFMIFLHLLMTLVANVNSGFVSWCSVQSYDPWGTKVSFLWWADMKCLSVEPNAVTCSHTSCDKLYSSKGHISKWLYWHFSRVWNLRVPDDTTCINTAKQM